MPMPSRALTRREFLGFAALGAAFLSRTRRRIPYVLKLRRKDTLIVLTDVHLGVTPTRNVAALADKLEGWLSKGAYLVIGGDFVDLWCAEDDEVLEAGRDVFKLLRSRPQKRWRQDRVWYVIGNHDFRLRDELLPPGEVPKGHSKVWDVYRKGGWRSFRDETKFLHQMRIAPDRVYHRYLPVRAGQLDLLVTHGDETDFAFLARKWGVEQQLPWLYRALDAMPLGNYGRDAVQVRVAVESMFRRAFARIESVRLRIPEDRAYRELDAATIAGAGAVTSVAGPPLPGAQRQQAFSSTLADVLDAPGGGAGALSAPDSLPQRATTDWLMRVGLMCPLQLATGRLGAPSGASDFPAPHTGEDWPSFPPTHLIMGHRHLPETWATEDGPSVTDAGTWLHPEPDQCNHVEVHDHRVTLHGRSLA